jgi:predicted dehydrogenase
MTISTAVIGLGIMGRRMIEHMLPHPHFAPVALWDPNPAAREAAGALVPEATVTRGWREAVEAADLVYLACPPGPRRVYALHAAETGKALFLEKPLGTNVDESRALAKTLARTGTARAVNFTQASGEALANIRREARSGALGELMGAEIVVSYSAWPRAWQREADWLRYRNEGGMTREVISHFLFFAERVLGPLRVEWAHPAYRAGTALCETAMLALLRTVSGKQVTVSANIGGAQPDRQELTIKGSRASHRVSEFYIEARSDGGAFTELRPPPADPRAHSLRAQLDELALCVQGKPNRLATVDEALRVQILVETMLGNHPLPRR